MTVTGATTPTAAKARGGFYTPVEVTRFLAGWAIRSPQDIVLEPSCGDGAFIQAAADRYRALDIREVDGRLIGIEREPEEATKARALVPAARIIAADFFDIESRSLPPVDAVIGNPPYIRYHGFSGPDREKGLARASQLGVTLTRLASSWAPFVVHATSFLAPRGRMALVLPAELLHTDYGRPVRDFLLRRFASVLVVTFDRAVFAAQVDAVLLLASPDGPEGLQVVRLPDRQALDSLDIATSEHRHFARPLTRWSRILDAESGATYSALELSGQGMPLGAMASVDIGFVSGADDFFVMSQDDARARRIPPGVLAPAIRRPRDVPGLLASDGDVSLLLKAGGRGAEPMDDALSAYLDEGAATGVAARYKCRVRTPWYRVPLPRRKPDAFIPYMSHHGPRLVVNDVEAWSTNLLHGVALGLLSPPPRALAVAMTSSLTLLSAEVEGRSYGGGVLKLETREAERLLVPRLDGASIDKLERSFNDVDRLVRGGAVEQAAALVDRELGIDHDRLWPAYLAFRRRRGERRPAGAARSSTQEDQPPGG